ncbi:MAG: AbrB/MazE/SpoVT family DNA-binding domain-containing protein [Bauldia sp.]|nr:AbrB/MazE/SpoVT family DNA-binding domain-containing protein [Bauldia sp.]
MATYSAKVTSKGQITLPADLRESLGVKPGDRVVFTKDEAGKVHLSAQRGTLADLFGIVKIKGPRPTSADIERWIQEARGARWARYQKQSRKPRTRAK